MQFSIFVHLKFIIQKLNSDCRVAFPADSSPDYTLWLLESSFEVHILDFLHAARPTCCPKSLRQTGQNPPEKLDETLSSGQRTIAAPIAHTQLHGGVWLRPLECCFRSATSEPSSCPALQLAHQSNHGLQPKIAFVWRPTECGLKSGVLNNFDFSRCRSIPGGLRYLTRHSNIYTVRRALESGKYSENMNHMNIRTVHFIAG